MKIAMNTGGIASTNAFVIADEIAKQAVLFDAPDHTVKPLLDEVDRQNWTLAGLWLTHGHFDHVADHDEVRRRFPAAKHLIHRLDEHRLKQPAAALFLLPFDIPPGKADGYIEEGRPLTAGSLTFEPLFTPGHSPGHIAFYNAANRVLIGGDLIIGGSIGRTDFPDCDEQAMRQSLARIMQLPDDTRLLPGHGEMTTLGEERRNNRALRQMLPPAPSPPGRGLG